MEFSKVKSFAHIVPIELNQQHFISNSFQQHIVRPSNDDSSCELHLKGGEIFSFNRDIFLISY